MLRTYPDSHKQSADVTGNAMAFKGHMLNCALSLSVAMGGRGGFGPDLQPSSSKLYRAEYAAVTGVILAYLFYKWLYLGGLDWPLTIFWAVFPDLVAFVPIGLSRSRREWPRWGSYLYNAVHTVLTWGLAFAVLWLVTGTPYWPILGWLGHISTDRAVGYGLRRNAVDGPDL